MKSNRSTEAAPLISLSFPDNAHTCVSFQHPDQRYLHNTPWPKNDSPSIDASLDYGTDEIRAWPFGPLIAPSMWTRQVWVESSPPDARGPVARSVPQLRTWKNRRSHECCFDSILGSLRSIPGTDTWEPRQYDTDNAISCVITFEICSLLPPYVGCCGNNFM